MKINSPAKLNLRLKITGVRKDGYHLLDSLFVPVSLTDEIEIEEGSVDLVEFIFPEIKKPKQIKNNTVEKTLKHLRELNPQMPFFKISVNKNIPIGAGMGGGSSNAGVLMKHLTDQYFKAMKEKDLINAAAHIGADVPFFLNPSPTHVQGIGEKLSPFELSESLFFVVIKPPFGVSSKLAYQWYDAQSKLTQGATDVNPTVGVVLGLSKLLPIMENDLEKAVIQHNPELDSLKKALVKSGAMKALMTGSGSAVFGIFKNQADADKACKNLQVELQKNYAVFSVHNI